MVCVCVYAWHVCNCGGTGGIYVRCSVYFCSCEGIGGVVLRCMVCDFGLDIS